MGRYDDSSGEGCGWLILIGIFVLFIRDHLDFLIFLVILIGIIFVLIKYIMPFIKKKIKSAVEAKLEQKIMKTVERCQNEVEPIIEGKIRDIKYQYNKRISCNENKVLYLTSEEQLAYYNNVKKQIYCTLSKVLKTTLEDWSIEENPNTTDYEGYKFILKEVFKHVESSASVVSQFINEYPYYANFINDKLSENNIDFFKLRDNCLKEYLFLMSYMDEVAQDIDKQVAILQSGFTGENRVNEELNMYHDVIKNLSNIRIETEETSVETDNIVISKNGVFAIEAKNFGENGSYQINISKDGQWTKTLRNGEVIPIKNVTSQLSRHIALQQRFLNQKLKEKNINLPYIYMEPIIVIANDNVIINNLSDIPVIRVSNIYQYMKNYKGDYTLEEESFDAIKNIFEEYNKGPQKFPMDNYLPQLEESAYNAANLMQYVFNLSANCIPDYIYKLIEAGIIPDYIKK